MKTAGNPRATIGRLLRPAGSNHRNPPGNHTYRQYNRQYKKQAPVQSRQLSCRHAATTDGANAGINGGP